MAAALGCNQSRISRIETGQTRISPEEVRQWLEAAGAPADTYSPLLELAERAEVEIVSWTDLHAHGWAAHQNDYGAIEREASRILIWQPSVIPGLLQSGAYVRHFLTNVRHLAERQVAEGVAARLNRQDVLYQPGTRLEVVVAEHVLRHQFGGAKVMAEQLNRVASLAWLPTVDLAVLPSDTDMAEVYVPSVVIYLAPRQDRTTWRSSNFRPLWSANTSRTTCSATSTCSIPTKRTVCAKVRPLSLSSASPPR
jgi:transcriptional regulator with XRE-family HTH domain